MNENSFLLKNINDQLGELNEGISKLQTRLVNTEACISNISQTQATLINRMAAKPELVAPTETDAFAVLKTADTPVASINIDGDYKALNRYECPTDPKIVDKFPSFSQKDHGKLEKLDSLVSKVDVLAHDVEILKIRTTPNQDKHTEYLNSISLQINENKRMMALLKARWAREAEEARIAEMNRKTVYCLLIQWNMRLF